MPFSRIRPRKPSAATLIALLALFVAIGGPAEAARIINGKLIKRGTIRSAQVKNRSLGVRDLSRSAVRSLTATPAGSIGARQIAGSSVDGAAVIDDSLTAADLAAGSVTNSELGRSAVSRSKIGNNAVASGEILAGAVNTDELARDAVTGEKVADGSLGARDVGAFAGTLTGIDFPAIAAGSCAQVDSPALTPLGTDGDLTDDAIVVTPPAQWDDDLTLTARATAPAVIRLSACNVGDDGIGGVDLPALSLRYVSFGT